MRWRVIKAALFIIMVESMEWSNLLERRLILEVRSSGRQPARLRVEVQTAGTRPRYYQITRVLQS